MGGSRRADNHPGFTMPMSKVAIHIPSPLSDALNNAGRWPSVATRDDLHALVHRIHGRQEDLVEGNLESRIARFETYELKHLEIAEINLTEFLLDDDHVERISAVEDEMPPIIYDPVDRSIIDGAHRANALHLRGEIEILAYVGDRPDPNWCEDTGEDEP